MKKTKLEIQLPIQLHEMLPNQLMEEKEKLLLEAMKMQRKYDYITHLLKNPLGQTSEPIFPKE